MTRMMSKESVMVRFGSCSVCCEDGFVDLASLAAVSRSGRRRHVDPAVCRRNLRLAGDPVQIAEGEFLLDPKRILSMTFDQLIDETRRIHKLRESK